MSLFEGDIISTPDTDEMKDNKRGGRKRPKRALIRDRRLLWPKIGSQYYIPYVITSSNREYTNPIRVVGHREGHHSCLFLQNTPRGRF